MARKPMITRTVKVTQACVLCLDIEQAEPFTKEITLPRTYKNDEHLLRAAHEAIDTENVKAVSISKSWVDEKLLGMTEELFVSMAKELPPRSKNADDSDGEASDNV